MSQIFCYIRFKHRWINEIKLEKLTGKLSRLLRVVEYKNCHLPLEYYHGNLAAAIVETNKVRGTFVAHSSINAPSGKFSKGFVFLRKIRIFRTKKIAFTKLAATRLANEQVSGYDRKYDSEAKILEEISDRLGQNAQQTGIIYLYSEIIPCASCSGVFTQFVKRYPGIELIVYYD